MCLKTGVSTVIFKPSWNWWSRHFIGKKMVWLNGNFKLGSLITFWDHGFVSSEKKIKQKKKKKKSSRFYLLNLVQCCREGSGCLLDLRIKISVFYKNKLSSDKVVNTLTNTHTHTHTHTHTQYIYIYICIFIYRAAQCPQVMFNTNYLYFKIWMLNRRPAKNCSLAQSDESGYKLKW